MQNHDADNLQEHVKVLATQEGRLIGTAGHNRARKYLCANLKHFGLETYIGDSYELADGAGSDELVNIIAVAPGLNRVMSPILLGAHYDAVEGTPGADDNAAAIAIALEIGKELLQNPADCDVILAFFDGEELGTISKEIMGSTKFYKKQCSRPVSCGFILDLVGHDVPIPNLESTMFVTGMESSSSWADLLRNSEPVSGIRWVTVLDSYVNSPSDHYIYVQNKQPYLFFSCGRWAHYHQPTDTFEKLSYGKMASFKDALLTLIRSASKNAPEHGMYDSTEDELFFLQKNLLAGIGMFGKALKSRNDIDQLAGYLLSNFQV